MSLEMGLSQHRQEHMIEKHNVTNVGLDLGILGRSPLPSNLSQEDLESLFDWGHSISAAPPTDFLGLDPEESTDQHAGASWETDWENREEVLCENLSGISKVLEGILKDITTAWCRVFCTFKSLLTSLGSLRSMQQSRQTRRGSTASSFEGSLETRRTLSIVHCYVLCVKIMSKLAENLWQEVLSLALALPNASQSSLHTGGLLIAPATQPSPPGSMNPHTTTSSSITSSDGSSASDHCLLGDLRVGESFFHMDPLGHALTSACTTLRTGIRMLCDIEASLSLPRQQGVASTGLPADLPYAKALFAGCEINSASEPCVEEAPNTGVHVAPSRVARLLAVFWAEEEEQLTSGYTGPGTGAETTMKTLQRCFADILGLLRQHYLSYYEIGKSHNIESLA
ncbi:hypothetical protein DL768_010692 [Monosporascus sp. mg162]|nr:hypothetical protein DL768_010692 [Monosporascus sp. mg162]